MKAANVRLVLSVAVLAFCCYVAGNAWARGDWVSLSVSAFAAGMTLMAMWLNINNNRRRRP